MYTHRQYCFSLWRQANKTSIKPVQILQNKTHETLKIMTKTRWRQSASSLYQKLQLNFNHIVNVQLAKIMHSAHKNKILSLYFGFS